MNVTKFILHFIQIGSLIPILTGASKMVQQLAPMLEACPERLNLEFTSADAIEVFAAGESLCPTS